MTNKNTHTGALQGAYATQKKSAGTVFAPWLRLLAWLFAALLFSQPASGLCQRVTLLIPSKPSIEQQLLPVTDSRNRQAKENSVQPKEEKAKEAASESSSKDSSSNKEASKEASPESKKKPGKNTAKTHQAQISVSPAQLADQVNASILATVAPQVIKEEVELLMSYMDPFRYQGYSMDPPRLFSIYRFDKNMEKPEEPASREDRLGDLEEIRYLDQKAMGANVGLMRPGLYQFTIETQPWWEQSESGYAQHLVKVMIPVYGQDWGWHLPLNLHFEIIPDVRPFGLTAPALFTGHVLSSGKPFAGSPVTVSRINTDKQQAATPWSESIALRTDASGAFSVVLNRPGWWCCMATREGAPLKGPDGQTSPLAQSTLLWIYVDSLR